MWRLCVLMLAVVVASCSTMAPVQDRLNEEVGVKVDGSPFTKDEVRAAIISGARARGWTPQVKDDSTIVASIMVRNKHYAEVEIPYSPSEFSIRYKDSKDLNYDPERAAIHKNYNSWVWNLSTSIKQALGLFPTER